MEDNHSAFKLTASPIWTEWLRPNLVKKAKDRAAKRMLCTQEELAKYHYELGRQSAYKSLLTTIEAMAESHKKGKQ